MKPIRTFRPLLAVVLATAFAGPAPAQEWPTRQTNLVLGLGPGSGLDLFARNVDDRAATAAYQMVMVVLRAAPVHRLACVGAQRVDEPIGGHLLQRAVHGRQSDALAAAAQFVV